MAYPPDPLDIRSPKDNGEQSMTGASLPPLSSLLQAVNQRVEWAREALTDGEFTELEKVWMRRYEIDVPALIAEIARLRQGLWDVAIGTGFDDDGDEKPDHLAYPDIVDLALREVERLYEDYENATERRGPDA